MLWVCECIILFLQLHFSVYAYLILDIWHCSSILPSVKVPVEGCGGDFIQVISCSITCRETSVQKLNYSAG